MFKPVSMLLVSSLRLEASMRYMLQDVYCILLYALNLFAALDRISHFCHGTSPATQACISILPTFPGPSIYSIY